MDASTESTVLDDGYYPLPALSVEDYQKLVGREVGRTDWIRIDQKMIDAFAVLTGDDQFIHINPKRAATSAFGTTIAHGFLTLSLIGGQGPKTVPPIAGARAGLNFGFERVRFVRPVPCGSDIRIVFVLKGLEQRAPGQYCRRFFVTVEIRGKDKPALVAEWLTVALVH